MSAEATIERAFADELAKLAVGGGLVKSIGGLAKRVAKSPAARRVGETAGQMAVWSAPDVARGMMQRRQQNRQPGPPKPPGWVGQ
jgi:hypothetical protein